MSEKEILINEIEILKLKVIQLNIEKDRAMENGSFWLLKDFENEIKKTETKILNIEKEIFKNDK